MITKIEMEFFKCFKKTDIEIAPLTLLAGLNSSGKSSIIQAIRIANEGKLLDGYGQCVSELSQDGNASVNVEYKDSKHSMKIDKTGAITTGQDFIKNTNLQYIGADRYGPQIQLPFKTIDISSVGERGEDVLSYINNYYEESGVPKQLRMEGKKELSGVKSQIQAWLSIISPGFNFSFTTQEKTKTAFSTFNQFMAKDVGFGLSYALPIIASVIISAYELEKNKDFVPIIIIENPEAHLHPSGQTKMGKFLALAASCGIQIIAETHSDHFLNGVRLAVKEKKINSEAIVIQFFKYDIEEKISENTPVYMDEYGMLDEWPKGFFDETEKTLLELL